jgi:hypothetical protein
MLLASLEYGDDALLGHLFTDCALIGWLTSAPEQVAPLPSLPAAAEQQSKEGDAATAGAAPGAGSSSNAGSSPGSGASPADGDAGPAASAAGSASKGDSAATGGCLYIRHAMKDRTL